MLCCEEGHGFPVAIRCLGMTLPFWSPATQGGMSVWRSVDVLRRFCDDGSEAVPPPGSMDSHDYWRGWNIDDIPTSRRTYIPVRNRVDPLVCLGWRCFAAARKGCRSAALGAPCDSRKYSPIRRICDSLNINKSNASTTASCNRWHAGCRRQNHSISGRWSLSGQNQCQ